MRVFGYFYLFFKITFYDSAAFLWSSLLPVIMAVLFKGNYVSDVADSSEVLRYLSFFWQFIIISVALNGVGLRVVNVKEGGFLKTYIAVSNSRYSFLLGLVFSQIIFCAANLLISSTLFFIVFDVGESYVFLKPMQMLLISMPFFFATLGFCGVRLKHSTLSVLIGFLTYPMMILAMLDTDVNILNPYYFLMHLSGCGDKTQVLSLEMIVSMVSVYCIYVLLGLLVSVKFSALPLMRG